MDFEYLQDKLAIKILKHEKKKTIISGIIITLLSIGYALIIKDVISENSNIIEPTIMFLLFGLGFSFIIRKKNIKFFLEIIDLNYPEGLLNLNIYYYKCYTKFFISKIMPSFIKTNYIFTSLNNIATAYYLMGDIENATKVVIYLETQYNNIKNKKLENFKNLTISNLKAAIAFKNSDVEEVKKQNTKLKEIAQTLPKKFKDMILARVNLREAVLENNIDNVNKWCNELNKSKMSYDRMYSVYYRAQILEKNSKEGFKDYYKYVAENGNTLSIAKIAREKLGINNFEVKNYKFKKNLGFKFIIILALLIIIVFLSIYISFKYERTKITWDSGKIIVLNNEITLPCKISEFEKKLGIEIDTSKINSFHFYELRLDKEKTNLSSSISNDKYKKINIMIEDGYIVGIELNISNLWNNQLDKELGSMVVFPENITANDSIAKIKNTYRTGFFNFCARERDEVIEYSDGNLYSYGISYQGNHYGIDVKAANGVVESILYFYDKDIF